MSKSTHDCSKFVAERLTAEIERQKGGVSRAASHLGKARNTVYNWMEKGNIPADQLLALADIGVDVQYVVTGISAGSMPGLEQRESALLANYRHCTPERRQSLEEMAAALAKFSRAETDRPG